MTLVLKDGASRLITKLMILRRTIHLGIKMSIIEMAYGSVAHTSILLMPHRYSYPLRAQDSMKAKHVIEVRGPDIGHPYHGMLHMVAKYITTITMEIFQPMSGMMTAS